MTEKSDGVFEMLAVERLSPCPTNPRTRFNEENLADLVASVREKGVIQPVLARPVNGDYELVYGHRRLAAAKEAGIKQIPTIIKEMSDEDALEAQVIENLQRADLHPLEEAEGYRRLMGSRSYSADDLAIKVGKSKTYIYSRLKLSELPEKVKKMFWDGKLTPSVALLVSRIPDANLAATAAEEVATGGPENNEPMTFKEAKEHIEESYMLRLGSAQFKTSDTDLVPEAGACGTCHKRTGNQVELFADIKGADVCTDKTCFEKKQAAHWTRVKAQAKIDGGKVLSTTAAKNIFNAWDDRVAHTAPYVSVDNKCYDDSKMRTYLKLFKKNLPATTLALNPYTGRVETLLEKKGIKAAFKKAGVKLDRANLNAAPPKTKEEKERAAKEKMERKIEEAADKILREKIIEQVARETAGGHAASTSKTFEALIALVAAQSLYGTSAFLSEMLGWEIGDDEVEPVLEVAMGDVMLRPLLFKFLLHTAAVPSSARFIRLAAARLGVNTDDLAERAASAVEASGKNKGAKNG